jgi:hypothetical protein
MELQGSLLDTTGDLNSMAMGGVDRSEPLACASPLQVSMPLCHYLKPRFFGL